MISEIKSNMDTLSLFIAKNNEEFKKYCYSYDGDGFKLLQDGKAISTDTYEKKCFDICNKIKIMDSFEAKDKLKDCIAKNNDSFECDIKHDFDVCLDNFCEYIKKEIPQDINLRIFIHFGGKDEDIINPLERKINNYFSKKYKKWELYAISESGGHGEQSCFPSNFFSSDYIVVNEEVIKRIVQELSERQKKYKTKLNLLNEIAKAPEIAAAILFVINKSVLGDDIQELWNKILNKKEFEKFCEDNTFNLSSNFNEISKDEKENFISKIMSKKQFIQSQNRGSR